MVETLNQLLSGRLRGYRSGLEYGAGNDRVTGYVVSEDFEGMDYKERRLLLARVLDEGLSAADRARVGPIVPMTPAEAAIKGTAA